MTVPASEVRLAIALSELKQLPVGAVYKKDSAQAHAIVWMAADTVFVESRCDSLQSLVIEYERRLQTQSEVHSRTEEQVNTAEIVPRERFSPKWFSIGFVVGVVVVVVSGFILKIKH